MQQQEADCEPQENTKPDNQINVSGEVETSETSPVKDVENGTNDIELEDPVSTTEGELEIEKEEENSNNEDSASDSPPTKLKPSRKSSKKRNAKKEKELESAESVLQSELKIESEIVITKINEEEVTISSEVTEINEEDAFITVDEPEETNTLDTSNESGHVECNELLDDDEDDEEEKIEDSQEVIVDEEIPVAASVSYEELSQQKNRHSEGSEKYSISVTSCEYNILNSKFNGKEKEEPLSNEEPVSSDWSSVSGSSWGGNIRSVSARRPVRRSGLVTHERSSVSVDRLETDENHSDSNYFIEARDESAFSSLKRKAFDNVTVNLKKRKFSDSMNSKFFSMMSSPLRLLRNKLSDRIVESPNAHRAEDIANGNNDDDDDNENLDEKAKEESPEVTEKTQSIMTNKFDNQSTSLSQSWCNLM